MKILEEGDGFDKDINNIIKIVAGIETEYGSQDLI